MDHKSRTGMLINLKSFAWEQYDKANKYAQDGDDVYGYMNTVIGAILFACQCEPDILKEAHEWWICNMYDYFDSLLIRFEQE